MILLRIRETAGDTQLKKKYKRLQKWIISATLRGLQSGLHFPKWKAGFLSISSGTKNQTWFTFSAVKDAVETRRVHPAFRWGKYILELWSDFAMHACHFVCNVIIFAKTCISWPRGWSGVIYLILTEKNPCSGSEINIYLFFVHWLSRIPSCNQAITFLHLVLVSFSRSIYI